MATFGSITRGPSARKRIVLPLPGATIDKETGDWVRDENVVELDVCGLGPMQQTEVTRSARAFAKKNGVDDPKDGDEIYEWGKTLYTLLVTCIDKDSPGGAPTPFFDGGIEQLHNTKILSPEHIAYLYEQQQAWQAECAPGIKTLSEPDFLAAVIKTAGGDERFFVNMRPGMRWNFTRTLAALHVSSLAAKSLSSSSSEKPTETQN